MQLFEWDWGWIFYDVLLVLFWFGAVPLLLLELYLTKRRAARYKAALEQIAQMPNTTDEKQRKQIKELAQRLVYDFKW